MRGPVRKFATGLIGASLIGSSFVLAAGATSLPKSVPGISAHQVTLGAIVTQGQGLVADFAPYLSGVDAYLDYVNANGGVYGRTLDLAYPLNDQASTSEDISDARTLVDVDHVFAVVGVSVPFFTGSTFLASTKTPTFGYATGNVWSKTKSLFADYGSVLNYSTSLPFFGYVAKQLGVKKVAVVSLVYSSSQDECKGAPAALTKDGFDVTYTNLDATIGEDWQSEANSIRLSDAQFVISCMDDDSDISLSNAMIGYNLHLPQLWLDGYDRTVLASNHAAMANVYLMLQHVPFEAATDYPSAFPGLNLYLSSMARYGFASNEYNDVALMGWESANLFTEGLKAAGKNPTQAEVVNDINKLKADTGGPDGGVTAPTNWTIAHTKSGTPACETFVKTDGSTFELAFNSGSHPWVCFPLSKPNIDKPVEAPVGTPGR